MLPPWSACPSSAATGHCCGRCARTDARRRCVALLTEPAVARVVARVGRGARAARPDRGGRGAGARDRGRRRARGLLLVGEEDDAEYRHASLDIALATEHQGQGLGPEALRLVITHLIEERGHHRFTIDPAGRQRARDPRLREARLQAGRRAAPLRARRRRHAGTTGCSWTCSPTSSCSVAPAMDWEAEGLLEGLEDDDAREAPRRAARPPPRRAAAASTSCSQAVAEDRLVLLPVERLLAGDKTYSQRADRRGGRARPRAPASSSARRSGSRCPTPTPRCSARPTSRARRTPPRSPTPASRPRTRSRSRACSAAAWCATPRRCACCSPRRSSSPATPSSTSRAGSRARPSELLPLSSRLLDHVFLLHMRQLLRNDVLGIAERTSGKVSDTHRHRGRVRRPRRLHRAGGDRRRRGARRPRRPAVEDGERASSSSRCASSSRSATR